MMYPEEEQETTTIEMRYPEEEQETTTTEMKYPEEQVTTTTVKTMMYPDNDQETTTTVETMNYPEVDQEIATTVDFRKYPEVTTTMMEYLDVTDLDESSSDMETTTQFVEENIKEFLTTEGEELLLHEGNNYRSEDEMKQTTGFSFNVTETYPTSQETTTIEAIEDDLNTLTTLSVEATTNSPIQARVDIDNDDQQQQAADETKPKETPYERRMKEIFPFITSSFSIIRPVATYSFIPAH